jgi:hypothetical protein
MLVANRVTPPVILQVDPKVLAATPTPEAAPAPESERPAVPPDDLAAAQMRMLVVGEILAEESQEAQRAQSSSEGLGETANGAEGIVPLPVLGAPAETGDAVHREASGAEDPPPLDD